jgi:hypothetical protein
MGYDTSGCCLYWSANYLDQMLAGKIGNKNPPEMMRE